MPNARNDADAQQLRKSERAPNPSRAMSPSDLPSGTPYGTEPPTHPVPQVPTIPLHVRNCNKEHAQFTGLDGYRTPFGSTERLKPDLTQKYCGLRAL